MRFPPVPASVGAVRRHVCERIEAWAATRPEAVDDGAAVLLASELATNAVLHARTDFSVAVGVMDSADGPMARLEVIDGSAMLPSQRAFSTSATTGRGIRLLADLSRAWGTVPLDPGIGKLVWAEVALTPVTDWGAQDGPVTAGLWLDILDEFEEDL